MLKAAATKTRACLHKERTSRTQGAAAAGQAHFAAKVPLAQVLLAKALFIKGIVHQVSKDIVYQECCLPAAVVPAGAGPFPPSP